MQDNLQEKLFAEDETVPDGRKTLSVLVPYPVEKAYDYAVPAGLDLQDGDYVVVPLGKREITGIVWGAAEGATKKLKAVIDKYDLPAMPKVQRDFLDWMAGYTMNPRGNILKMALSAPAALKPASGIKAYKLSKYAEKTLSPVGRGQGEGHIKHDNIFQGKGRSELHTQRARDLRQNQTDVEKKLWQQLNNRQLQGFKFRRQYDLHPYIADFACVEKNLIVELDGGQHADAQEYDNERTKYFESKGFRVLRFWNNEVNENLDGVLQKISETLDAPHPHPDRKSVV
jgi:very-short-patch-repair endonuclease